MARLSFTVLGPLDVLLDGQSILGLAYDKVWALLVYLALEADRPHRRDALIGLLWPDKPEQAARTNLRQALTHLRQAIGDDTAQVPFLLITREIIQFNRASDHELDVSIFEALLDTCDVHPHRHRETCTTCARRCREAAALYRSSFLEEFFLDGAAAFEEWALLKREALHDRALVALTHLANYDERRAAYASARGYAHHQLMLDPWNEAAHRQVMRTFALTGQRSAALRQYATCRQALFEGLGVAPEAETTRLYEHIRDGMSSELPMREYKTYNSNLKTQNTHNFPTQTTPLIGRETELLELGALLENPTCRLITIVGPGGTGKTRLALAAAAEQAPTFIHGASFVPLAGISSAEFMPPAILTALDVEFQGQREPCDQMLEYLCAKELLLVLDNFEHLLEPDASENHGGVRLLLDVLQHAPGVTLLITSRERLALGGEWLFDLSGLSYPTDDSVEAIEAYSAVQLFMQRAGQVRRQFALASGEALAVARICRMVEGLPLAIELAAAALRSRSCIALATTIETSLAALAAEFRAVPERHRSMWATFEHSWNLLSDEEHKVFPRLSVFRGGFEADAAAQVAQVSPQILATLVDKSLLRWDGVARYDIHELMRQYAGEKLEQVGATTDTGQRHAGYFLKFAQTTEPQLHKSEQALWLARLEAEHDNLRTALRWAISNLEIELGLRLAGALGWFWYVHDHNTEGRGWLNQLLTLAAGQGATAAARVKALNAAAALAYSQDDYAPAAALLAASLRLAQEVGDSMGRAWSLHMHGLIALAQGDYTQAIVRSEESLGLYQELGDSWGIAASFLNLGNVMRSQGCYEQAKANYDASWQVFQAAGDKRGVAFALREQGLLAQLQGDCDRASVLIGKSLLVFRELKERSGIAWSSVLLGRVAQQQGNYTHAAILLGESLRLYRELHDQAGMATSLEGLATVVGMRSQPERSARLLGASMALREATGAPLPPDERAVYERTLRSAQTQLDEATWIAAWAAGHALTLEQAITEALSPEDMSAPGREKPSTIAPPLT